MTKVVLDIDFAGRRETQLQDGRAGIHFAETKVARPEVGDQQQKFWVCGSSVGACKGA